MADSASSHGTTNLPLAQLHFDPENPRLPKEHCSGEDAQVIRWMLSHGDLIELMLSIASSGYSDAEPLLITGNTKGNGYIVVEGNRRLAALKLLQNPGLATLRRKNVAEVAANAVDIDYDNIPVIVYSNRGDILDYLGYRHITGVKPWGPREKAEYLRQIYDTHKAIFPDTTQALSTISKMIGTKPFYAKRLLDTLAVVQWAEENAFWGSEAFTGNIESNFSVLHTALSYERIRSYIGMADFMDNDTSGLDPAHTKNVLEWVCGRDRRIRDSREIKTLNAVLDAPRALEMLQQGATLSRAAEYSGAALENYRNFLQKAYDALQEVDRLTSRLRGVSKSDVELAVDVQRLSAKIAKNIRDCQEDDDA